MTEEPNETVAPGAWRTLAWTTRQPETTARMGAYR